MFWTAGASLEMREKRAAFPRHVKAFITICVRLIHTPDVAAPVAVVCLDTLTIWFCRSPGEVSVSPPPAGMICGRIYRSSPRFLKYEDVYY